MHRSVVLALCLGIPAGVSLRAEQCVFDISTGFDQETGLTLLPGEADDDYVFDRGDGALIDAITGGVDQGFPIPPWVANDAASLWVSSVAGSQDLPGTYTYEIRFFIDDAVDTAKLALSGSWTADDQGTDVVINGTATGLTVAGFNAFSAFPVNFGIGLFVVGENVIQFVVSNSGDAANPTGLRVRACVIEAAPEDRAFDISTGFDEEALIVLSNGQPDDSYEIEGPAGSGIGPGPATVVNDDAFPIPPWIPSTIQSKWVGPQADSNGPTGEYRYTVTVTFAPGVDPATARLFGGFATDDTLLDILINDASTGIAGGGLGALTPFPEEAGRGLFLSGENTITFVVSNGGDAPGPTGLRVDGEVSICQVIPAGTRAALFSLDTGYDDETLSLIPNGEADDNYAVLGPAGSQICNVAATIVDDTAYPVPPWVATTVHSKWVGVQADSIGPPGRYAFETVVTLPPGYDAAQSRIVGAWAVDNGVFDILVNEVSLGISGGALDAFQTFPEDTGKGLFQTGDNLVRFVVDNAPPGDNPVGLRIQAVVGVEDPRLDDLSTGVNPRGVGALPSGALDPRYRVTGPTGSGIGPRPATVVAGAGLPGAWVPNSSESVWAGLDGGTSSGPAGAYRYRIEFVPSAGVNPTRASIVGRWTAAGEGTDVLLNGTSLGLSAAGPGSFEDFPPDLGKGALLAGAVNALEFVVENAAAGSTGLRVEAKIEQDPPKADLYDISTGYDQTAGLALNEGSTDDDYTVILPGSVEADPATVVSGAPATWIPNAPTSAWIGGPFVDGEPGTYVFETFVNLTEEQAQTATLVGAFATDNGGTDVQINDISTGLQNTVGFASYTVFPPDFGQGLFVEGQNSIRFLLENVPGAEPNVNNPVGLRVEAAVRFETGGPNFRRGDADGNGALEITDPILTLGYLFLGEGNDIFCLDAADADDNGELELTDAVYSLGYQFLGGENPAPPPPGEVDCGPDPTTEDELDCQLYEADC